MTGEYDPSEMALQIAETEAGARYFTDMAQFLQSSLTWDSERMGTELYPVIMHALDAIEEARTACGEASEALGERLDKLITEMNAPRERKLIGIRIPLTMYDDLGILRAMSLLRGDGWTVNGMVNGWLDEFIKEHRAEIDEFRKKLRNE